MPACIDTILDTLDVYLQLVRLVTAVAGHAPIKADALALGLHPFADLAEEGELAALEGVEIVAQLDDAAPLLIERAGQVRTLGALLAAAEPSPEESLELLAGIAVSARWIAENTPGGPADLLLRIGLAARTIALHMLGEEGSRHDKVSRARGSEGSALGLDGYTMDTLTVIAFLGLTEGDKLHLTPAAAAA